LRGVVWRQVIFDRTQDGSPLKGCHFPELSFRERRKQPLFSAGNDLTSVYVNHGTLFGIFDSTAENFMGYWGRVAFTQEDEAYSVNDRVDVGPVEVDMGDALGSLLQVDEQTGDGIGNRGAPGTENTMGVLAEPVDRERLGELRCIPALHLDKVDAFVRGQAVEPAQFACMQ